MKSKLTLKQQDIYSFIRQYITTNSESPTLDEIRKKIKVGSINTVTSHLKALEDKEYILRRKHAKRNIEIRQDDPSSLINWIKSISVVASVGCDDLSVFAEDKHDEFIHIDANLIEGKGKVVAVRAVGNSMNDADIHNGDYVLIQLTEDVSNGDRVAAIVGDMVTVKKYEKRNGLIILRPESNDPKYKPIILREDFKIAGKVICSIPGESMDVTEVVPIKNIA